MFAVVVELLAGRYAATAYNDRERVEWPPHPARLFSALVATWGEDEPRSPSGIAERAALEWLELQEPPEILADREERAGIRSVVPVFVPVNDEFEVGEIDREKLAAAEAAASALEGKAREKADKGIDKLRKKLVEDTRKATAVPTKYGKEPRAGLRVLPELRGRQPRTFPVAFPQTPQIAFVWADAEPDEPTVGALSALLGRLVRLGHSSSQVRAVVAKEGDLAPLRDPDRRFRPDDVSGEHAIRWVGKGQVAQLCRAYDLHRETEPRVLPARFVRYTHRRESEHAPAAHSCFVDDFLVLERTQGPRLPITSVVGLARQFRRALMSCAEQPVETMISGHRDDGAASEVAHVAIVPLPFVGHRYADGGVLGLAVILPRDADAAARRAVARALMTLEDRGRSTPTDEPEVRLDLGREPLRLRRVVWDPNLATLAPRRWTAPSRRWATATPIALDRNPGDLHDANAERRAAAFANATASVAEAIARIGLPPAIEIDVVRSCVVAGNAKPGMYPRFPIDTSRIQRVLVHARLVFAEPVAGPVLLGAGRYHGLGLCIPIVRDPGGRP